jgi:hypothetical protein
MVGAIELSAAPNFLEEAQRCLHLASAEPKGELRTILEGMARGWLKMADCAWVSEEPESEPDQFVDANPNPFEPSGPPIFNPKILSVHPERPPTFGCLGAARLLHPA